MSISPNRGDAFMIKKTILGILAMILFLGWVASAIAVYNASRDLLPFVPWRRIVYAAILFLTASFLLILASYFFNLRPGGILRPRLRVLTAVILAFLSLNLLDGVAICPVTFPRYMIV